MSGKINDGGTAFPIVETSSSGSCSPGMTLRDFFAAAAMQGICAHPNGPEESYKQAAEWAYEAADAMLAARERKGG